MQAWKAADRFNTERQPAPWLYAIARRVCVDLYRRERRHQHEGKVEMAVSPIGLDDAWEHWQVRVAIDQLPSEEREVIRCTHFLGLTQAETAERLGLALGTVKSRSFRAYRRLAVALAHLKEVTG